jgi:predicted nucleotidyltransferase
MNYYERITGELIDVLNNYPECILEEKIRISKDLLKMLEEMKVFKENNHS